ncbi:MAG: hypothetical protein JSV85_05315 [Candidatus Bathyarchaeota archaeon]|nr:MAG: hypothetical protein JSV85_05315 [Candidatus Bathyarchaeota archaeon]
MTRNSWFRRIWKGRSKGLSTVVGTVFLMLIIFMVSTNVLLWTFSQDAEYNQAVKNENQMNIDRLNENVIASGANYSVLGDDITVRVSVTNAGPAAVQIVNLWVFDTDPSNQMFTNKTMDLNLNPGEAHTFSGEGSLMVTIPGADVSHYFVAFFVTARGNMVPLETDLSLIEAALAQGIGSISMSFPTFRYYEVNGSSLGPEQHSFNLPAKVNTVIGIYLKNLDSRKADIYLSEHSCFWLSVPSKNAMAFWKVTEAVNGTLVPFDGQTLPYGEWTLVLFGPAGASQLADNPAACNILLYGTIGTEDYGQNIPFISLYLSS